MLCDVLISHKEPTVLENANNNKLLGFTLLVDNKQHQHVLRYILPDEPWQVRSAFSATSTRFQLSSFTTRSWIIKRGTFPACNRFAMYSRLLQLYIAKGYDPTQLTRIVNRVEGGLMVEHVEVEVEPFGCVGIDMVVEVGVD